MEQKSMFVTVSYLWWIATVWSNGNDSWSFYNDGDILKSFVIFSDNLWQWQRWGMYFKKSLSSLTLTSTRAQMLLQTKPIRQQIANIIFQKFFRVIQEIIELSDSFNSSSDCISQNSVLFYLSASWDIDTIHETAYKGKWHFYQGVEHQHVLIFHYKYT